MLTADVRPRAPVHVEVKVHTAPARIAPEVTLGVRLVNCAHHGAPLLHKLAADVNVPRARAHCGACYQASLHQFVGLVAHDLAVLAGAWLALITVDHKVGGATIGDLAWQGEC